MVLTIVLSLKSVLKYAKAYDAFRHHDHSLLLLMKAFQLSPYDDYYFILLLFVNYKTPQN